MPALARFLIVFAATLVTAAAIGKLVPHIPRLAADFGVSLGSAGFLVSAVMLPGALAGPLFGALADRAPPRGVAAAGLALAAASSAALPYTTTLAAFVGVRLLEGVGYTLVIIAATLMVVEVSAMRHRALALATFSSFAPLGFALGQLAAAGEPLERVGWSHAALLALLAIAVLAGMAATPPRAVPRAGMVHTMRHAPALRTAMAFGCVAGLLLGAVAVAPLALAPRAGLSIAETAQLTAIAALPGVLGRFLAGWLLGRATPLRLFAGAALLGLALLPFALAVPAALAIALGAFAGFQLCMGALAGIVSAMLPQVAPSSAELGTVTGLANQMVTAGNLAGPPLALAAFAAGGAVGTTLVLIAALAAAVWLVSGVAAYRSVATNA